LQLHCCSHVSFYCRNVIVAYGSQTGNSEHIAKDIHEKILQLGKCASVGEVFQQFLGLPSKCLTLNSLKKTDLKAECLFLTVVCSTTGNGDSPENAEQWWRSVKLRSAVSCAYRHSVLILLLEQGTVQWNSICSFGIGRFKLR